MADIDVLLHGANGRMGQVIAKVIKATEGMSCICGVDQEPGKVKNDFPVYASLDEVRERPDALIDFSHHSALDGLLDYGLRTRVPLVICTTGFSAEQRSRMGEASKTVAILNSSNMSLGINLVLSLVRQAAPVLCESFDIEIVEKHHNQKVDSPSGTAIMIAEEINSSLDESLGYVFGRHSKTEKRGRKELGIHAVRGGAIVGEHDVIFAGQGEVIEIRHSALSRDVFAYGAVRAAQFVVGKEPWLYTMRDVIENRD